MSAEHGEAVDRVVTALELTSELWDKSPDIQRDMAAETLVPGNTRGGIARQKPMKNLKHLHPKANFRRRFGSQLRDLG